MQKQGRVLLFDDELDVVSKIYIDLLLKNFEVEITMDPKEITIRVKRFQPHMALVNGDVADFDGKEVCQVLKEELNIPVALIVNHHSAATIYIDSCRADDIISKPIKNDQLLNIIYRLIHTQ